MGKINVAYIAHDTGDYGGSALSLLNMISSLGDAINPVVICREEGHIVDVLRRRGVDCIVYPFTLPCRTYTDRHYILHFPTLLLWHLRNYRRETSHLAEALKDRKIDIVHTNNSISIIGARLARLLHARHVWHIREYLKLDHGIRIFGGYGWLRRMVNRADAVIANSSAIYRYWNMQDRNGHVVGNAVRKVEEAEFRPQKQKYILFCSALLSEKKGTFFAAEAFFRSGLHKDGYRLRMIGRYTGETVRRLEGIAARYAGEGFIDTPGFASNLKEEYCNAAAYLMASENEALGRVTIEAMFCGCPVVARATGGTPDIVEDGVTGHLFTDIDECASLLRRVVETDQHNIIRQAAAHVCANFSEESFRESILSIYKSLVNTPEQ